MCQAEERLERLAAETGRPKPLYLQELIERGLEDIEDRYRAEASMERIRNGQERIYTLNEAERKLGLAG